MLATLGLLTILALLAAVLTGRMSPLVALIAVPTAASLLGGFGAKTGAFIVGGIREVAPVAGMFVFAILYFGIMADAGLLDPIIDRILRAAGGRPTRIVPGTALPGAAGPPRRLRGGDVPGHDPGDAPDVRAARDGPAHPRRRRLAGRGRELPPLDGAP